MSTKKIEAKRATPAVLSLLRREGTPSQVARRLAMSERVLYRLRDRFLEGGPGSPLNSYLVGIPLREYLLIACTENMASTPARFHRSPSGFH